MKSFQLLVKVNRSTVARAGLARGMMMRQQMPSSLERSMRAASASSRGRDWKNWRRRWSCTGFAIAGWQCGTPGAISALLINLYLRYRLRVHALLEQGGAHER